MRCLSSSPLTRTTWRPPVLAELARWEWTMTEVFDAADAVPLTHEALAGVAPQQWARLRFAWHPSVRRLALSWNVPQILAGVHRERRATAGEPECGAAAVAPVASRLHDLLSFRSLTDTESAVLDAARNGWPFGELCELLCDELGEAQAPAHAAALLRDWGRLRTHQRRCLSEPPPLSARSACRIRLTAVYCR